MKNTNTYLAKTSGGCLKNQHKVIFYFVFIAAFLSLTSCEKVIQLNLNNTTPRVVIQADVYDHAGPYYVKISKSVNFDQSSVYPPVTGARVELSDNSGQSEVLSETVSGTYLTKNFRGVPGRTYQLNVRSGNETFQATSVMPYAVKPDSIYFSVSPFSGDKVTIVKFTDPPLTKNYYRLIYIVNNVQIKSIYVLDDELFQGATIGYTLMPRGYDINLENGSNVVVWVESIDPNVYEYFRTAVTEGGQPASPSNPVSNISNGALGYFNACSERKISRIVGK